MEKLSFVIPCYNSEHTVKNVIERIIHTVTDDQRYDYEIICVNDCSPDGTYKVLEELAQNKKIKVLNLSRNFGQHAALMAGFHYVTGDIIVCLDDDGQNPPEEMFLLIDKLEEGYDLVSAKYTEEHRGFMRRSGTRLSFAMSNRLAGKPKDIELNSYYVFRRFIIDEIIKYNNPYPFVHGLILQVTKNMANVEVTHEKRMDGRSGYSFRKLFSLWVNGFTAFSVRPLRIATFLGIIIALAGFAFGIFIIVRKILHPEMVLLGYSSMMAVMLFLLGVVMLFLGMLGEYIGRIYVSLNNVPQYSVRDAINVAVDEENGPADEDKIHSYENSEKRKGNKE